VDGEDSVFYISAQFMDGLVGIEGSMEEVEDVDEWIGLNIMDQFKSDKDKMSEYLLGEFDDVAAGGGCTFRIRASIPNPPNDGDQHEARARIMIESSKVVISTIGKPRHPIKGEPMSDILFGTEKSGEYESMRADDEYYFLPPEILILIEYKRKGGIILEYEGSPLRYKVEV
jgi:hypothetical protein